MALPAGFFSTAAFALDEIPPPPQVAQVTFGLVGLAHGETARLSVVAVGGGTQFSPNPCVVSLRFLDASGKPFRDLNGGPVEKLNLPLFPGQAVALDLPAAVAFGQSLARRVAVRAAGDITSYIDPELACPKPVATLELFDNFTGRTQVLGSVIPDLFPQSPVLSVDPELLRLGMMGLARGQTARLNVMAMAGDAQTSSSSCMAMLGFVDATGKAFTDANGMPIADKFELVPGQATELDLRGADAFRGSTAMRRDIRATLAIAGVANGPCARPLATVEIFDVLTGRTQVLYPTDPEH
jgi:hypothetical protein